MKAIFDFKLPPETEVIRRNRTITNYYADLYQQEPALFKWAGMAAFASFHIGERLQLWQWQPEEIESFSLAEEVKSDSLEDDFQIIRSINNHIFADIGWVHLAFCQADFEDFRSLLLAEKPEATVISAFEKLHRAKQQLQEAGPSARVNDLVWQANTEILWHEQARVVQPAFDKLSEFFSSAMTLFASFDYSINHHRTTWRTRSRFGLFMFMRGLWHMRNEFFIPDVTNLHHRWYWITNDLLKNWRRVETREKKVITAELDFLADLEGRDLPHSHRPLAG